MRAFPLFALCVSLAARLPAASNTSCSSWSQVSSPNIGLSDNVLDSVAANSPTDIWAVGLLAPDSNPNITQTLVQHFDGTSWSVVASPNQGTKANALLGVTANSGMAWAVGYFINPNHETHSLIEVWNGTAWSIVDHPRPGTMDILASVTAVSPTDIWAVGLQQNGSTAPMQTLVEHFDGSAWSIVPSASPGSSGNQLWSVYAIGNKDVWAAGQSFGSESPDRALIEHWDGSQWSVSSTAAEGDYDLLLYGIAGTSASNLWAVGDAQNDLSSPRTLVERLTNGQWSLETALNVGPGENHLYGLAVQASGIVYAVGTYAPTVNGAVDTLVLRRDSSGWALEATPNPGLANGNSELASVAIAGPSDVWAVGAYDGANASQTLILHRCR